MEKYSRIINLPHHVSKSRPQMTMYQRAAQFAPFAALTGHDAAISETARLTESRIELSDDERSLLNQKVARLLERIHEHPDISVTYFMPDSQKEGGRYICHSGTVRKWDDYRQVITFDDGTSVSLLDIISIATALPL